MKTLFLMPGSWDLAIDARGNIAIAESTYQQAQDIASACRTIQKDLYFNQSEGIPYLTQILGNGRYPLALYRKYLQDAALSVPGVVSALPELQLDNDRILRGQIKFTTSDNQTRVVGL
ncbi:hypothetical protein [Snodgrassella alvi]|uniref:hypothetical protein n=1 Tax=Snodgrassella alvi TaxID=1196083 RepID=UPI0034E8C886